MTTYRKDGKDVIIFATADDHREPSKVILPEPEPQPGLILPNGEINWNCPCLGGMATGPCGVEFREAFSCFHNSEAEPKGSDCFDAFKEMHLCMAEYPELYNKYDNDKDVDIDIDEEGNIRDEGDSKEALDKKMETKIKDHPEKPTKEVKVKEPSSPKTTSKLKESAEDDSKHIKQKVAT